MTLLSVSLLLDLDPVKAKIIEDPCGCEYETLAVSGQKLDLYIEN
jgi:hypothetical protein